MSTLEDIALWIIAISVATNAAISVWSTAFSRTSLKTIEEIQSKRREHQDIKEAMDDGRYADAVALALNRQKLKPGDPYSWYYAGICYHHMKEWDKALAQFREAQTMFPTWEEKYTGPYIRVIQEQMNATKS